MVDPEGGTAGDRAGGTVVPLEAAQAALRDHFLGWQCRLRQLAVRQAGGRPTSGMRPEVRLAGADTPLGSITTLIVRKEPRETTAQFRHMVRKTQDPAERYDAALETLAAALRLSTGSSPSCLRWVPGGVRRVFSASASGEHRKKRCLWRKSR